MKFPENEWRDTPIPGYKVSKGGKVWSYRSEKYLKPFKTKRGYLQVQLAKKSWYLSHLVLWAFTGVKPRRVRYLDGNIKNCSLENLKNISGQLGDIKLEEI
jgi:hypothetical protein